MPANPMQRKVRNSFLLGILVMLVIAILIGAIVFLLVIKPSMDKQKKEAEIQYAQVYQLKSSVKSGENISTTMIESVQLPVTSVPNDAIKALNPNSKARIDLGRGTVLSSGMVVDEDETLDNSLRTVEYNMITLPAVLDIGETIDVRLSFSNGQDLIVLSKKVVQDIYENTILLELTEGEILTMNSAIVEAYVMPASQLYITKYVQAGDQTAAIPTYVPTQEVQTLIASNANITQEARTYLTSRYIAGLREYYINPQLGQYADVRQSNIETGIQKQIKDAQKAREDYLSELNGY